MLSGTYILEVQITANICDHHHRLKKEPKHPIQQFSVLSVLKIQTKETRASELRDN